MISARKLPRTRIFEDQNSLAEAASLEFEGFAAKALTAGRQFSVALSGGSTPALFFQHLTRRNIDWANIDIFWGDERCVPPDHPESNYLMTRRELLDKVSIPEANILRIRGEDDPSAEASRYARVIARNVAPGSGELPAFDWIFLGLGTDGHTASIFPGAGPHPDPLGICAVARHPETGQERITLTLPVINNAARITFLAAGSGKAKIVKEILGQKDAGRAYPASLVNSIQGRLEWYLDREAAGELTIDD